MLYSSLSPCNTVASGTDSCNFCTEPLLRGDNAIYFLRHAMMAVEQCGHLPSCRVSLGLGAHHKRTEVFNARCARHRVTSITSATIHIATAATTSVLRP